MAKQVRFDDEARAALRRGVDQLANAVKVTLGPRGRNVVIERKHGAPTITNDGVTIAREIELADPFENLGVELLKEVAAKTAEVAGDGTTTATLLAQSIVSRGLEAVAAGANPAQLRRGIEAAVAAAVSHLAGQARPVRSRAVVEQVARVAAQNDESVGALLADAMERVGADGVISVEEARGVETTLEVVDGLQFDRGYLSPYFVNEPDEMAAVLDDAWVLLTDHKVASVRELLPAMDLAAGAGRPLLLVADDVQGEALATLVVNKLRGTVASVAVKAPEFGERQRTLLEDVAVLTGGRLVARDAGVALESVVAADFGRARRVRVDRDSTTLIAGGGRAPEIRARIAAVKRELEQAEGDVERDRLRRRVAVLAGGVAVIRVGAATELELKEKKSRLEDALAATHSAVEEGIVPGGGAALLRAGAALRGLALEGDQRLGCDIVRAALAAPCAQIAANAGAEGGVVVARLRRRRAAVGYNAAIGVFEDLFRAGIVDPAKVVRVALQNAASIGALVLTTDALVTEAPEEEGEGEEGSGE